MNFRSEQIHTTVDSTILVLTSDVEFSGIVTQEGHGMKIRSSQHHNLKEHICVLPLVRRRTEEDFDEVSVSLVHGYSHVLDLTFAKPDEQEPEPTTDSPISVPKSLQFVNNLKQVSARGVIWFEDAAGNEHQVNLGDTVGTLTYEEA